ncbi:MAG: divergent PAP2 family protein, partial [Clostridia bacterium]|nr:divergent PAP2 family protein [Clostridia bacterium]
MNEFAKSMGDLFTNPVVLCAALSWFLAQIIKLITSPKYRKGIDFLRFAFGSGGMPSSHSAVVMGACISCGILEGFDSTVFALSGVLALVVMRDALGIRREAG